MSRSYSYSMLSAALRCTQYYKYLYIDKLVPEGKRSADLHFGSSVHFAMEQFFIHQAPLMESFLVYWSSDVSKLEYGRNNQQELESIASILLPRFERLHAKKIKVAQIEQRLFGFIDPIKRDIKIEGTPDILGDYEGVPSVIDFKTAGYRYPKEKVFVNEQMYAYAHLAKQNEYEAKQVVYIVFIKGREPSIQVLKRRIHENEMNKVLANLSNQCQNLDMVEANNTWVRNTSSCQQSNGKCPFFNKCYEGYDNE